MLILFAARAAHALSWLLRFLPLNWAIKIYSSGRIQFMQYFCKQKVSPIYTPSNGLERTLWGLKFKTPLMNSAGMFKNGEGYAVVAAQGAGGYIGGTSTNNRRAGNTKAGIKLPFLTLPLSNLSLNFLGLPNLGDGVLSQKQFTEQKSCPLGWSVMRSPDFSEEVGLELLVKSLWMYHDNEQIDFIEINESCPNIKVSTDNITKRLAYIADNFISKRRRHLPVVVKLSNDISCSSLHHILDALFKYHFDGINLGNTSTNYAETRKQVAPAEMKLFDYFSTSFGGGIGGRTLKAKSLNLCKLALEYKNMVMPGYEFHVIRSGGIDTPADIHDSDAIGVSLNQWYTGYFSNYLKYGNQIYQRFFNSANFEI